MIKFFKKILEQFLTVIFIDIKYSKVKLNRFVIRIAYSCIIKTTLTKKKNAFISI